MEEEKKEVVEEVKAEEVKTEQAPAQQGEAEQNAKYALNAFIAAAIGVVVFGTALGLLICGIISKSFLKKIDGPVEKKPHAVFFKIAKIAAPIEFIVGLILTILAGVGLIIYIGYLIIFVLIMGGAAAEAASSAMSILMF